jgi:hypothetical protein
MKPNPHWRIIRSVFGLAIPRCCRVSEGILITWRWRTAVYLLYRACHGRRWYDCEQCGQRWCTEAAGARYWAGHKNGKARIVGLCAACREEVAK